MNYEKKLIQLKRRRVFICDCCTIWHDNFLGDYKKSVVASSVEENAEFICIIFLGVLYVYQSYRHWKLEKLVFKQLCAVWNFQHMVVDALDKISKRI